MWEDCGIVRSDARLEEAYRLVTELRRQAHELFTAGTVDTDLAETRNLCDVALLMVRSARRGRRAAGSTSTWITPCRTSAFGMTR
jgi:aspartate oxidase